MQGKSRIREKGFETVEKIGVIGAFGFDALKETTGGQPVKTRTLYYSLCEKYGRDNVLCVETYRWKKNPVKMILELMLVIRKCNAIILLPAQNGIKVFLNVLLNTKKKNTRLYYDVIGGWIAEKANGDLNLLNQLKMLDGIWVETSSMKNDLSKIGILNTEVIPNFKNIQKLELSDLPKAHNEPYYFCTFSRVMEEKGITQAITTVNEINNQREKPIIFLDIYGPIDEAYKDKFEALLFSRPWVQYKGVVDPEKSVDTVKGYDALLFPTRFYTEGIPGTIIDSYSAGVPIMTSLWMNSGDVFWDGETGWGYDFDDEKGLEKLINRFLEDPNEFFAMKETCLDKAELFSRNSIMKKIAYIIETGEKHGDKPI